MATTTVNYSSNTTITMDLSNLGSSADFTAGRESSQIDNTSNKYVDALVQGTVTVGTTPTANTLITVHVWGSDTSLATTAIDTLDGTDSAETITNPGVLASLRVGASVLVTAATSDVTYPVLPFSVAQLFGGVMPKFWGLFVSHNTGVALKSTLNTDTFTYVGIKYDVA